MDATAQGEKVLIQANVGDERRTDGIVYIKHFSPPERMSQALKKLALFWGIALVSVLIPVFHFVTVPLFFFLGLFFARRTYKSEGRVLSGETRCPHCQTEVKVKPAELQWPITEICQNCARVVRIERV
ncbi:hypothetical protein [Bdellovibrio sp. HCB-162]|uniref:hypothetical protein n=1 Tax=Bdellovibrio sp. HCB-162 TaxID=3394234 RepID=UPI0039BD3148